MDSTNKEYPKFVLERGSVYEIEGVEIEVGHFKMITKEDEDIVKKITEECPGIAYIHEYRYVNAIMPIGDRTKMPKKVVKKIERIYSRFQKTDVDEYRVLLEGIGAVFIKNAEE